MTDLPRLVISVQEYDLAATLTSGQAFRWNLCDGWWEGVIGGRWVRLRIEPRGEIEAPALIAETTQAGPKSAWLSEYLQLDVDFPTILGTFPDDEPMRAAGAACRGLRLLRQEPWECLASFILSSTKQIVQIRQIVGLLCERYGEPLEVPPGYAPVFAFPTIQRLADCTESDLRNCKMGFRAPYLRETARMLSAGSVNLENLRRLKCDEARAELLKLPGVGPKIADCVLLFAYGFQEAFPVDVWVMKALRQLYFPRRRVGLKRLQRFTATYFGPNAGYAQQYLFHYMRLAGGRVAVTGRSGTTNAIKNVQIA